MLAAHACDHKQLSAGLSAFGIVPWLSAAVKQYQHEVFCVLTSAIGMVPLYMKKLRFLTSPRAW